MDGVTAIILAAGEGKRMRSRRPKVLHPVCGRPMVEWVVEAAREAGATRTVCVIRPGEVPADLLARLSFRRGPKKVKLDAYLAQRGQGAPGATGKGGEQS